MRFWDFCLDIYARPGVSAACLELQHQHCVVVPLLLCSAWLGARGVPLSPAETAALAGAIRDWDLEVVQSLRSLRTKLKTGPRPALSPEADLFREKIKAVELDAEKLEIELLERLAVALPPRDPIVPRDALNANLQFVLDLTHGGVDRPDADVHVETIVNAVLSEAGSIAATKSPIVANA